MRKIFWNSQFKEIHESEKKESDRAIKWLIYVCIYTILKEKNIHNKNKGNSSKEIPFK